MLRCLKRPRRTYSKVAVSLLVLMWICAFLYNKTHIYFTLSWKERTFKNNDLKTENTTKMNTVSSSKAVPSLLKDPKKERALLAMPTHNRIGYVQLSLLALKQSTHDGSLHIFDDASTEYGLKELKEKVDIIFVVFI